MRLSKLVEEGFADKNDLNCAETILYGANRVYELGLDREALKLAAGFGGGMGVESTCGALTAAVMVIGRMFSKSKAHDSPMVKELCARFLNEYRREMGSIDCKPLKERYRSEELKCRRVVLRSAQILERLVVEAETGT